MALAAETDIAPSCGECDRKSHDDIQQGCCCYHQKGGVTQLREYQKLDQADDENAQGQRVIDNDMIGCSGCLESLYIQGQKACQYQ